MERSKGMGTVTFTFMISFGNKDRKYFLKV